MDNEHAVSMDLSSLDKGKESTTNLVCLEKQQQKKEICAVCLTQKQQLFKLNLLFTVLGYTGE